MISRNDPKIMQLAQAIAKAEGFGPPTNLPTRINNPGDMCLGDRGYGVQSGKTIFPNVADGWAALTRECYLMLTGESHLYNPTKTFLQVATLYTGGDAAEAWATIVSGVLGLTPQNTLEDFLDK